MNNKEKIIDNEYAAIVSWGQCVGQTDYLSLPFRADERVIDVFWLLSGLSASGFEVDYQSILNWEVMSFDPSVESRSAHVDRQEVILEVEKYQRALLLLRDPIWKARPEIISDGLLDIFYGEGGSWSGLDRYDFKDLLVNVDTAHPLGFMESIGLFLEGYWPYETGDMRPVMQWCWAISAYAASRGKSMRFYPGLSGFRRAVFAMDQRGGFSSERFMSVFSPALGAPVGVVNEIIRVSAKLANSHYDFTVSQSTKARQNLCSLLFEGLWERPLADVQFFCDSYDLSPKQVRSGMDILLDAGFVAMRKPNRNYAFYYAGDVVDLYAKFHRAARID